MSQALAKRQETQLVSGFVRNAVELTAKLEEYSKSVNLVTPATSVASIPEGCEVAISAIQIDPDPKSGGDVYEVGGGKLGLSKYALDRISNAAGISWDAHQSRRLDDARDPHYCHYKAVGVYRHFDGTEVQLQGEKEMDLREGSAQVQALWERYESGLAKFKAGQQKYPPKDPTAQIREMRLHILAHAESKAKLRAIRSMGIKTAYTAEELKKPFMVARLMWTGQSQDPALRAEAFRMRGMQMMGGMRAMYGAPVAPPPGPALMPAAPAPMLSAPPVGSVPLDDDDYAPEPEPEPAHQPTPKRSSQPRTPAPAANAVWPWEAKKYGDPAKGTPLTEIDDRQLEYLVKYCERKAAEGGKFAGRDAALGAAAADVLRFRSQPAQQTIDASAEPIGDGYDRGDDPDKY